MISKIKKIVANLLILFVFVLPLISLAQERGNQNPSGDSGNNQAPSSFNIKIKNPLKNDTRDLVGLLNLIIDNAILPIGGVIAAIMIIYAGFMYVTARGDPTKVQTAHRALLYAAIGTAILLGARILSKAIEGTVKQIGG